MDLERQDGLVVVYRSIKKLTGLLVSQKVASKKNDCRSLEALFLAPPDFVPRVDYIIRGYTDRSELVIPT